MAVQSELSAASGLIDEGALGVKTNHLQRADSILTNRTAKGAKLKLMKTAILPIIILLALGTFARAADPADDQWEKMFKLMYDIPRPVKDSRLEQLKSLIDQGADVNMTIGFDRMLLVGETRADLRPTTWPLDLAVQQGRLDMVKLLLANGAKLHGRELAKAAFIENQNESLAMVTTLLEAGANANSRNDGFSALLWASYRGNKKSVKLLLAQPGIKLDETDYDGRTALMWAAERGHAEIVEMLLQAGANTSIMGKRGGTAMDLARKTLAQQQAIVEKQQTIISRLQSPPK